MPTNETLSNTLLHLLKEEPGKHFTYRQLSMMQKITIHSIRSAIHVLVNKCIISKNVIEGIAFFWYPGRKEKK